MILWNVDKSASISFREQHLELFKMLQQDNYVELIVDGELFATILNMENASQLIHDIKHQSISEKEWMEQGGGKEREYILKNITAPIKIKVPGIIKSEEYK